MKHQDQEGFDWYKFMIISMVAIGIGFFLFSFLYTRHDRQRLTERLEHNKKMMEQASAYRSFSRVNLKEIVEESHQVAEDFDEFIALLEAIEDERALEQTTDSPDFSNGNSRRSEKVGDIEDIDYSQRNVDPALVEAVITEIHENTENYREILLIKIDLYEGRAHLYPEAASPDYPEQLQLRSEEARIKASELWNNYLWLTEDFDAFNPGGWINEAYSGMATLSGNASTKMITTFFSDDMLAAYE